MRASNEDGVFLAGEPSVALDGAGEGEPSLLIGLFVAAMALRIQLVGLPPLIPEIRSDLGLSHSLAGVLLTIPILCMGVFALGAPRLVRLFRNRTATTLCLLAIAAFGLVRALAPSAAGMLVATGAIGIALGLGGGLLPIVVKHSFARRPAFASGVYAAGIQLGAAAAAVLAVPLANWTRGWRGSLVAQSGAVLLFASGWVWLSRGSEEAGRERARGSFGLRDPVVWLITAVFALQAFSYYGLSSWLPEIYVERGWSERKAGALLGILNLASLVATVSMSWLMERVGSRRVYLIVSVTLLSIALLGILYGPSLGWLWGVSSGVALGLLFVVGLTLPLDVVGNPRDAGAVAGFMLAVGYTVAAIAPFVLGWLRDVTGTFDVSVLAMLLTMPVLVAASFALSPRILQAGIRRR
jgi:CP family cyanate transporter-like MFS transporter